MRDSTVPGVPKTVLKVNFGALYISLSKMLVLFDFRDVNNVFDT